MHLEIVVSPHPSQLGSQLSAPLGPLHAHLPAIHRRDDVATAPRHALRLAPPAHAGRARDDAPSPAALRLAALDRPHVLDVYIDGANVTASIRETHGALVLRDLALALVELGRRPRAKAAVRFYDEPWELCVERFGPTACLSVYRTGNDPFVALYDRAVPFDDVVSAARDAIEKLLVAGDAGPRAGVELASAAEQLRGVTRADAQAELRLAEPAPIVIEPDRDGPISFGAEFAMRESAAADAESRPTGRVDDGARIRERDARDTTDAVERADLHALLFRGRMRAEIRGRAVDLGECHPMLVAERLIELSRRAFDAWERGLALHARGEAAGVLVGVRVSPDGDLALTLGAVNGAQRRTIHTFPALGVADVLEAALSFGRALVRAILRRDRTQSKNLRLGALRRALRESTDVLRSAAQTDTKVNPTPEPYRAFASPIDRPAAPPPPAAPSLAGGRLRYVARWRAIIPAIDLRATYLCGDRVVVGAATEMWALDRTNGRVLWRVDTARGTSVVTPAGVARLSPDGALSVYDMGTGERTLRARIAPRVGPVAGAVVHMPGLPRLVVVTEGEHHLVAVDLATGELRWRWSWGAARGAGRGAPRMKRAGKLVYFTCGDGALTALDVMTGAVVWRVRDRLRFRTPPTVAHDAIFVVSGGTHGVARLYSIDPYSGHVRWSQPVTDASAPCTVEGAPLVAGSSVAVAVRQKSGLALMAFRREDGEPVSAGARALAPTGTSWLAIDDAFVGNAPTGEVVAIDARSGDLRWRHVLGPRPLEADIPRRLEPVLRSGALFVPCSLVGIAGAPGEGKLRRPTEAGQSAAAGVTVLRPADGAVLGTIAPTEAIPDLLRVDERCDVYVAEESGHLAAFGALPRLSLVE